MNRDRFHFSAIIPQQEASRLFANEIRGARVRLRGRLPGKILLNVEGSYRVRGKRGWTGTLTLGREF